jgi:hypothetical protein
MKSLEQAFFAGSGDGVDFDHNNFQQRTTNGNLRSVVCSYMVSITIALSANMIPSTWRRDMRSLRNTQASSTVPPG